MRPTSKTRAAAAKAALSALVALAVMALLAELLGPSTEAVADSDEQAIDPLPPVATRCKLSGEDALKHARAAEAMAHARWERVPFAVEEAPRALMLIVEAELCYGTLDREGRLRSSERRREYEGEIGRRFARARLLLRVAAREQRLDRARQQIAILRALLQRSASEAEAYRAELEQLDRAYAAQLIESAGESSK